MLCLAFSLEELVGDAFMSFLRFLFFLHHSVSLCHMDLRVGNLIINDGHIVLLDYGFARDESSLWNAGAVIYLPEDMHPSVSISSFHHDLVVLVHSLYVHQNVRCAKVDQCDSTPIWYEIMEDTAWDEPRQLARHAETHEEYIRLGKLLDSLLMSPH